MIDILPLEVINIISLKLNPLILAVNKQLYKLYNDEWYHDYLKILYPDVNLWKRTTYKDLYCKSLESKNISVGNYYEMLAAFVTGENPLNTIKQISDNCISTCINYYNNKRSVLTFNGDLYFDEILVDNCVVSIDRYSYAKNNKWITFTFEHNILLENIIKVGNVIYNLTTYIYVINPKQLTIFVSDNSKIITINFNNIKDVQSKDNNIYVLETDGTLYSITLPGMIKTLSMSNIKQFNGDGVITNTNEYISYSGEIINADKMLCFCGRKITLSDGDLYIRIMDKIILSDVKDIYVHGNSIYICR